MAAKLLLVSVVISMIALPILTARNRNATRALKNTVFMVVAFNVLYLLAVRYLYPLLQ
jgi:hypothetical protein